MSRILFGSVPLWGHTNPTIAIAQKLMDMGHTVGYACHPEVKNAFEKANISLLDNFQWGEAIVYVNKILAKKKYTWQLALKKEKKISPLLFHLYKLEEGVKDFLRILNEWRPDVCIFDILFFPGIIAAEILNIPYASSCPLVLPLPSNDLLPFGLGFPSYQKRMDWKKLIMAKLLDFHTRKNINYINKVRQQYNLAPTKHFFDARSPYLYFAYTTDALEFKRSDLLPQVYFIGPSISDRRGDIDVEFPWQWLEGDKPIVYFSMGTIFSDKKVINKVIKASKNAPWKLVVSIGNNLKLTDWPDIPENVLLKNYVPQPELLRRVDVAVSHGGNGTMAEALSVGVPLVVIPQLLDHFDAAQRVVEVGAGLRLDPLQATVKNINLAIAQVLSEPSYRQNAARIAQDYSKCDAAGTAAALILKLAEKRLPLLRPEGLSPTIYANDIHRVLNILTEVS